MCEADLATTRARNLASQPALSACIVPATTALGRDGKFFLKEAADCKCWVEDVAGTARGRLRQYTKIYIVSFRDPNYQAYMVYVAGNNAWKRVIAIGLCISIFLTSMAAFAMDHSGHTAHDRPMPAANEIEHHVHHVPSDALEPECCEPDPAATSNCHVSTCCVSPVPFLEFSFSGVHVPSDCGQRLTNTPDRSISSELPERPPRTS
jgi:hypothetical protein